MATIVILLHDAEDGEGVVCRLEPTYASLALKAQGHGPESLTKAEIYAMIAANAVHKASKEAAERKSNLILIPGLQ